MTNGLKILEARKNTKLAGHPVSQEELRRELGLSHKAGIVDIEIGRIEVTDEWTEMVIGTIHKIADRKQDKAA